MSHSAGLTGPSTGVIPDFQSLMLPVLRHLSVKRCSTTELVSAVSDDNLLTPEQRRELLPSGRQPIIANRTHWALAYLNRAGLITRVARGQYEISGRGKEALINSPARITVAYLSRFPEFRMFRTGGNEDGAAFSTALSQVTDAGTPEERLELADRDLKIELAATLLKRTQTLSPSAFERLIIDLMVRMGYGGTLQEAGEHTGGPGDGGIDGMIREDALGLDMIYLQAKRYAHDNAVGAPAIQGFAGALLARGATKGVFVTTGRFTPQARQSVNDYKSLRVILLDGRQLAQLMIEHEIGVRSIQTIRVQRLALDPYEDVEVD